TRDLVPLRCGTGMNEWAPRSRQRTERPEVQPLLSERKLRHHGTESRLLPRRMPRLRRCRAGPGACPRPEGICRRDRPSRNAGRPDRRGRGRRRRLRPRARDRRAPLPHQLRRTPRRREGSRMMAGTRLAAACAALALATPAFAHDPTGIEAEAGNAGRAPFDIVAARITTDGNVATFRMAVSGQAGETRPTPAGKLAGSEVFSYVWPTSLDSSEVGFDERAGILAFAVTAHPDFDDTPLFDENGDGDPANDGDVWHSHWVVLGADAACGPGALKVIDIPEGTKPRLPKTWPRLPLLVDSPGWQPLPGQAAAAVRAPLDGVAAVDAVQCGAVTTGLRGNANLHAPLLCVTDVFDVASGDLSLPGRVNQ